MSGCRLYQRRILWKDRIQLFIPNISIAPLQAHYYSEALPTASLTLCRSSHAEALQATTCEGLAQGPDVAARVGLKPETFRTQGTEPTTEPPHPPQRIGTRVGRKQCLVVCLDILLSRLLSWSVVGHLSVADGGDCCLVDGWHSLQVESHLLQIVDDRLVTETLLHLNSTIYSNSSMPESYTSGRRPMLRAPMYLCVSRYFT